MSDALSGSVLVSPVILARLRAVFARLEGIEGKPGEHSDAEWIALLSQRELADSLAEDAWLRGYVMGILDALGMSVTDGVPLLRTPTRPKRRMVQAGERQGPRVRSEGLASRKIFPGDPSKGEEHAGE